MDTSRPAGGVMPQDFLLSKEQLLARQDSKWRRYASDVIPAYVADMDFRVAPAVQNAILKSVDIADYGYQMRDGKALDRVMAEAFAARMEGRFGWKTDPDLVQGLADLVQATFACVTAFSEPGDGVVVQVPNYPPFRAAVEQTGRKLVPLPMVDDGKRYVFDLEALEKTMPANTRVFILCSPQNPMGRCFDKAELEAILAFAERRDLIVVADEIHSDIVFDGRRHIPFASLGPAAAARTATLTSATKSFNIPGLRTALISFGTPELKARFHERIPGRLLGSVNALGVDATVAAWTSADDWLDAVVAHLQAMRDRAATALAKEIPGIRFRKPEATYLTWLDCTDLGIEGTAFDFFHDKAKVAFSAGETFLPGAEKFVRMNLATSAELLDEMIGRMADAVRANAR